MKHSCDYCNFSSNLYFHFRRHLKTYNHQRKSNTIITDEILDTLDINRLKMLSMINNGSFNIKCNSTTT